LGRVKVIAKLASAQASRGGITVNNFLQLSLNIGAVECFFIKSFAAILAIPTEPVNVLPHPASFYHYSNRIGIPHRIVRHICRKQKHFTFSNNLVFECQESILVIHKPQHHVALDLIEPFLTHLGELKIYLRFADVIVAALIGPTHGHDNKVISFVHTPIIHRWLQLVLIFFNPLVKIDG
jgi:hypothetical protein